MLKNTHLKVILINYVKDTKQQSLLENIADSVPFISIFPELTKWVIRVTMAITEILTCVWNQS